MNINAATSAPPILPATTERHKHQVPQPLQPALPVQPPQEPAPAATPDHLRAIQQPIDSKDDKGKGRSDKGNKTSPQLASFSTTLATPPKHVACEPIINSTVYTSNEKADKQDDHRHHTYSSYASDAEKQSYNGYGIPSENQYLTVSNHPGSIRIGRGDGARDSAGAVDRHLRGIMVRKFSPNDYFIRADSPLPQVYLSIFSTPLTILVSLYAFFAVLVLLLIDPVRFCIFRIPLSKQLERALLPPLRFQLRMIHSFCPAAPQPPTTMLVAISIASPICASAIAVASWVAAVFWFYTMILGDPNPSGQRENDGRSAAMAVLRWWERWLQTAVGL